MLEDIYKSFENLGRIVKGQPIEDVFTEKEFAYFLKSGYQIVPIEEMEIMKAEKDITKLIKKEVWVTRDGRTFKQTVYVKPEDKTEIDTPIGEEVSPDVKGLNITRYSDKAILIKGETKAEIETLRALKQETGFGVWNSKLMGWLFSYKNKDVILGRLWTDEAAKGNEEKAQAIQNQKNATLIEGDKVNISGIEGEVKKEVSDSEGVKYDIQLPDGTELNGVDEKVISTPPLTDDKKIVETISNTTPEGRVPTEKKLYGIQPITDIHKYSLSEYMGMHGISQEDIDKVITSLTKPRTGDGSKKGSNSGSSKKYSEKGQIDGLTKRQLILKLIYAHRQAVKKAIESGEELNEKIFDVYPDLAEDYKKKRAAMSEETKRKISEALKKNKVKEVKEVKPTKEEIEPVEIVDATKKFEPIPYEPITVQPFTFQHNKSEVILNPVSYLSVPVNTIIIPKPKNISSTPKPNGIPDINEESFERLLYNLSAIKLDEDKYLVALDGFTKKNRFHNPVFSTDQINDKGNFAVMSLDLYVITSNYYKSLAKEKFKLKEIEKAKSKNEKHTAFLLDMKEKIKNSDYSEEVKLQKLNRIDEQIKVDEAEIASSKYKGMSKPKSLKEGRMTTDQFSMIHTLGSESPSKMLTKSEVWGRFIKMKVDYIQKNIDLEFQSEENSSTFKKGRETSYGESGTKDDLKDKYGIKIKRQNGDDLTKEDVLTIERSVKLVESTYGNNKELNKDNNLKVSFSGETRMHAMKALGVYFPTKRTIGFGFAYGSHKGDLTFVHEYSHYIDNVLGSKTDNWFASDKQGTLPNRIATVFGRHMNDRELPKYYTRTCEKFARAMEQYTAMKNFGDDVEKIVGRYVDAPEQVSAENFNTHIKPLIEQFLSENREILKSLGFDLLK